MSCRKGSFTWRMVYKEKRIVSVEKLPLSSSFNLCTPDGHLHVWSLSTCTHRTATYMCDLSQPVHTGRPPTCVISLNLYTPDGHLKVWSLSTCAHRTATYRCDLSQPVHTGWPPTGVISLNLFTADGHLLVCSLSTYAQDTYRCDDTRHWIIEFWPPDDEHIVLETCRGI